MVRAFLNRNPAALNTCVISSTIARVQPLQVPENVCLHTISYSFFTAYRLKIFWYNFFYFFLLTFKLIHYGQLTVHHRSYFINSLGNWLYRISCRRHYTCCFSNCCNCIINTNYYRKKNALIKRLKISGR